MTTAAEIINLSLRDAGVLASGETADAAMMADAFTTLQQMLSMWQIDKLFVYASVDNAFTPTGATSYTVGTGGAANFAQPPSVDYAYWRSGGIDYPITLTHSYDEYAEIAQKTMVGNPQYACFERGATLGLLYVYPQPSTGSMHLVSKVQLPALTATTDTLTVPPEYMFPVRFSLAELYCVMFGVPISPDIAGMAKRYKTMLKRSNAKIPLLKMPSAVSGRARSEIFAE